MSGIITTHSVKQGPRHGWWYIPSNFASHVIADLPAFEPSTTKTSPLVSVWFTHEPAIGKVVAHLGIGTTWRASDELRYFFAKSVGWCFPDAESGNRDSALNEAQAWRTHLLHY